MAMDITPISVDPAQTRQAAQERPAPPQEKPQGEIVPPAFTEADIKVALQDLEQVSLTFNRRLQFSVNQKLNQVVVKVIDMETDTVIREIPPKELQMVHERIREAIGLLLDERI